MADQRLPRDERHHSEPEIIPPGQGDGNEQEAVWGRGTVGEHRMHRIYVTKVGPFGLLPLMLLGRVIAILRLVFLFGILLIFLPLAGLILAVSLIRGVLRGRP